jgi:hypothetical protein
MVVKEAEAYYRAIFHSFETAWNIRDRHMFNTLIGERSCVEICPEQRSGVAGFDSQPRLGRGMRISISPLSVFPFLLG